MTETVEKVFEVDADGKETLMTQQTFEAGSEEGRRETTEENVIDESGNTVVRRKRRHMVTMANGQPGEEVVEEELMVMPDGRKAVTKRTRRMSNVEGNATVTHEEFAVDEDGESKLVKESKREENRSPLKSPRMWKHEPKETTTGKEEVAVLGLDGTRRNINVKTERKAFEDGMVSCRGARKSIMF